MSRFRTTAVAFAAASLLTCGSLEAQAARESWTADRRGFIIGDAITVMIDEHMLAASNQGNFSSDRRFRDLGLGAAQSGASALPNVRGEVSTSNQAESRQRGEATRQNRFQGEMTVRVLSVEEGGLLRIEGRKVVNIDRTSEELLLRGLVRPQDVTSANTVDSWRIGETELIYTSRGTGPRSGILGRLLGAIWP